MKKNRIFTWLSAISLIIASCGSEQEYFPQLQPANTATAGLKFVHAASDTVGVNLFLNGSKITGNSSSLITSTGAVNIGTVTFQNVFPVTNYAMTSILTADMSVVVPTIYAANDTFNTKQMSTLSSVFEAGKNYTVAFVGVSPNYETVVIEDDMSSAPLNGKAYLRLGNLLHNLADNISLRGTPPVDAIVNPTPTPIMLAENIAYKSASGFIELPQTGTYTSLQIINANTSAVITTLAATSPFNTFVPNKVYTIFARGRMGGGGTSAPGISRYVNR